MIDNNIKKIIQYAIAEDLGNGDVTTSAILLCMDNIDKVYTAEIIFKQDGVFVGKELIEYIYKYNSPDIDIQMLKNDGDFIKQGEIVCRIKGQAYAILTGERLVLNFLQRFSGIATTTKKYVDAVSGTGTKILDTRKTNPGLRKLDRYAVKMGGGVNHRFGLFDQVLIKENHLRCADNNEKDYIRNMKKCVKKCKEYINPKILVEIEVENKEEALEVSKEEPDILMFDNMSIDDMVYSMDKIRSSCHKTPLFEASGNITLNNVRQIADCGVDRISIGALTHSFQAVDISLIVRDQ